MDQCTAKAFSKRKKSNRKKSMKAEREKKEISSDFSLFKGRKEINCYNDNTHTSDNKLKEKTGKGCNSLGFVVQIR